MINLLAGWRRGKAVVFVAWRWCCGGSGEFVEHGMQEGGGAAIRSYRERFEMLLGCH